MNIFIFLCFFIVTGISLFTAWYEYGHGHFIPALIWGIIAWFCATCSMLWLMRKK